MTPHRVACGWIAVAALGVGSHVVLVGGQAPAAPAAPPVLTAAQAAAGRDLYQARCAGCHLNDLAGRNDAPALIGTTFMGAWRTRTPRELAEYVRASMPPGDLPSAAAGTLARPVTNQGSLLERGQAQMFQG